MRSSAFDLSELTRDPTVVAAVLSADDIFGLLKRSLNLPPYWAALLTTTHGERRFFRPGTEIDGDNAEELMLFRTAPIRLQFNLDDLISRDAYPCRATVELDLEPDVDCTAASAFRESVLGSRRIVRIDDLRALFSSPVREGVSRFVRSCDAAAFLDSPAPSALFDSIRAQLAPRLFEAGMTLRALSDATVDSESFRQAALQRSRLERQRDAARAASQLQEAVSKARRTHLVRLEESLNRLKTLSEQAPQTTLQELLKTFPETQRGELYEALWSAGTPAAVTRWIVAAAGDELLYYDPNALGAPVRRERIRTLAGSLRSLACDRSADGVPVLLVGAASGAVLLEVEQGTVRGTYPGPILPDHTPRGGFNALALAGEHLFGTHSELGLVHWRLDQPTTGRRLLTKLTSTAQTVRHVQFRQGRIWLSIDANVYGMPLGSSLQDSPSEGELRDYRGSRSAICSVAVDEALVLAGNADGDVLLWQLDQPDEAQVIHRGARRPVEGLAVMYSGGVARLFFCDTSTALQAQVLGDTFLCRYQAGGQTIRRAEVAEDWIVATNENRDRLFCWPTGCPTDSPTVIPVGQLTGRSIQDVCLVPQAT